MRSRRADTLWPWRPVVDERPASTLGAEAGGRQAAESFRVVRTRTTSNARAAASDYRFEERGGLTKVTGDTTQDLID